MPLSPPVEIRPQQAASWSLGKRIAAATIATLFAAATAFGSLYVHASRLLSEANGRLLAHSVVPDIPAILQAEIPEPAAVTEPTRADLFDHASWNQYRVRRYAFDAVPLDDDLALEYGSILADLKNVGYAGPVVLDIYEGLFCVNYTSDGSVELAPSGQLAMACDRIGTRTETVSSAQQSLVFSNMLAVATRDGQLSVETVFHGAASPIVDYPALDYGVTAGDWNSVAALNQRVSFRLGREGPKLRGNRVANVERPSNLDGSVFLLER